MKLSRILSEAAYPGNIGAMEVFQFYRAATDDEKETFDSYLDQGEYDQAWELIQSVTGVKLHPMGEGLDERRAEVFSDPIESITVSRSGHEMTFPVVRAKLDTGYGWWFKVHTPQGHQKWHYNDQSKKIHHNYGHKENRVLYIGELVSINRKERSAA